MAHGKQFFGKHNDRNGKEENVPGQQVASAAGAVCDPGCRKEGRIMFPWGCRVVYTFIPEEYFPVKFT